MLHAPGPLPDGKVTPSATPRLDADSFLHRCGSALNHDVHHHACVTDGVFIPGPDDIAFLPARPITPADLASVTERVRIALVDRDAIQASPDELLVIDIHIL